MLQHSAVLSWLLLCCWQSCLTGRRSPCAILPLRHWLQFLWFCMKFRRQVFRCPLRQRLRWWRLSGGEMSTGAQQEKALKRTGVLPCCLHGSLSRCFQSASPLWLPVWQTAFLPHYHHFNNTAPLGMLGNALAFPVMSFGVAFCAACGCADAVQS